MKESQGFSGMAKINGSKTSIRLAILLISCVGTAGADLLVTGFIFGPNSRFVYVLHE